MAADVGEDDAAVIDPAVRHHLVDAIAAGRPPAAAADSARAPRAPAVRTRIAHGLSDTDIADRLFISEATVKTHVDHLLTKIDVRDRAQAVAYAHQHGRLR